MHKTDFMCDHINAAHSAALAAALRRSREPYRRCPGCRVMVYDRALADWLVSDGRAVAWGLQAMLLLSPVIWPGVVSGRRRHPDVKLAYARTFVDSLASRFSSRALELVYEPAPRGELRH
ncbi:hypothetical protein [Goodfellowiella coeruleoviolacea]|uniref:Uncharacterized protein n=1 Tax=Goodfellowiella coeruleoviolacea TaxID=334858 RepID=A0AAE3GCI2_9PSEU|nr:hypothetical protein [Goodfellowiella coeruleoviolacea]MCP2164742.1 hypothetical protein [Goodfellowiella coeruleoviolacea]